MHKTCSYNMGKVVVFVITGDLLYLCSLHIEFTVPWKSSGLQMYSLPHQWPGKTLGAVFTLWLCFDCYRMNLSINNIVRPSPFQNFACIISCICICQNITPNSCLCLRYVKPNFIILLSNNLKSLNTHVSWVLGFPVLKIDSDL